MFKDRGEVGRRLAEKLGAHGAITPVVMAVNAGGLEVAEMLAGTIHAPVDVIVTEPIMRGDDELGVAAAGGGVALDDVSLRATGLDGRGLLDAIEAARARAEEDFAALRGGGLPFPDVRDRVVVVVSDGVDTIHDELAALRSIRAHHPRAVILAVPFFPLQARRRVLIETDGLATLGTGTVPDDLYDDFHVVGLAEAHDLFRRLWASDEPDEVDRLYHGVFAVE